MYCNKNFQIYDVLYVMYVLFNNNVLDCSELMKKKKIFYDRK